LHGTGNGQEDLSAPPAAHSLLAHGALHFASKVGQLAGNHFITLTSGLDRLCEFGRAVLYEGAKPIRIEAA
jgi:hypothetical protein